MRRGAVMALLIIVCFILQSTVFQALSLAGISPNLLLIVTTSLGFLRGEKEGMAAGFFCGQPPIRLKAVGRNPGRQT